MGEGGRHLPADRTAQGPVRGGLQHGAGDRCAARCTRPTPLENRCAVPCNTDASYSPGADGERERLRRGHTFVCPWMRCPICDGELLWRQADLEAGTERLACTRHDCTGAV